MAYVNGSARPMGAYFSQQGSPIYSGAGAYFSQQGSPIYSGAGSSEEEEEEKTSNPLVVFIAFGAIGFLAWKLFVDDGKTARMR